MFERIWKWCFPTKFQLPGVLFLVEPKKNDDASARELWLWIMLAKRFFISSTCQATVSDVGCGVEKIWKYEKLLLYDGKIRVIWWLYWAMKWYFCCSFAIAFALLSRGMMFGLAAPFWLRSLSWRLSPSKPIKYILALCKVGKTRFNCANHFHLSRELSQPFTRRPLSRCFPASFALRVWTFAKGTIFHAAQLLMVTMKLGEPQNRQILRWNHHRRSNLGWLDLRMAKHGKTTLCSPETNQSLSCLASLAIFMYSFNHRILVMLRNPYRNIPWDLQAQTKKTLGNFQLWKTKKTPFWKTVNHQTKWASFHSYC